jgi:plastocyanin
MLTPQNKKWLVLAIILIVLVDAGGTMLWLNRNQTTNTLTNTRRGLIQISASGFTPSKLTIKRGTTVVWQNADATPHIVASNPYPANDSLPGLRSKSIPTNGSYTFTPSAVGTINYHDDLTPTHNGVIVVTE